ncbi:winged helix-turn-helix transcriptional regulator [Candidatus Methanarcanum hacksteinii]|uniref:winged helix-turn-helix transcriptional regulator n=1 Tax=Candidatus Methanarcanum hacksteinii TaxID=2911857 RepID=UPI0037DCACE1
MENRFNCAIDATMSVIEGRWKGTILCMLAINGPMRFSELQKSIGEITSRILTKQLKELEGDRMIRRNASTEAKIKVEYSLTDSGWIIIPVLKVIGEWGLNNQFVNIIVPEIEGADASSF